MRVLVTGGAGYIGSFTVRDLVAHGHEPHVVDNLSTGRREAVPGVPLHVVDVRHTERLREVFAEAAADAVIHFAGLKSAVESQQEIAKYYDVNVAGTASLLAVAAEHGVERVVFSSSCAVYGHAQVCPVDERASPRPASPYGETKLACENMLGWYGNLRGIRFASLRYFNAAGAAVDGSLGEFVHNGTTQLLPRTILAALGRGPELKVYGKDFGTRDGTAVRDYIHVADLARAHVQVLEGLTRAEFNGSYNLGTGRGTTVLELVQAVERVSGRTVPAEFVESRSVEPAQSWADTAHVERTFGWTAQHDLTEIVRTAWEWHQDQPWT
ncbi:UDP-glucose 4-epimerase GalE [Lentzea flaviverrucosa]|uniref:UDP-glucose 4-epimerase n=1 Tax=Lentzea flaviverrucosa TaxID=200379 RepID=A0A1H9WTC7_9PSEU|nr:UDP-glucose 4-epimerase GalE [Lentzea flaviverrucosa]RDI23087.1 UDP-glucose 4-epimerase/UDP-arabinose 4-epimerase [Lentzea flaviverrucosa]SES37186.1 UDP-glucose 4-epimerase/UDP-arabinose 4-epimerase [Lentzea flaviverrucosa]